MDPTPRCNACDRTLKNNQTVFIAGEYFVFCTGCIRKAVHRVEEPKRTTVTGYQLVLV